MNSQVRARPATLNDYAAALARRWVVVAICLVVGAGLGLYVLPKVTTQTKSFQATMRLDIKSAPGESGGGNSAASSGKKGSGGGGRFVNITDVGNMLKAMGPDAAKLSATKGVERANWPLAVSRQISGKAVSGSSWVDMSYVDGNRTMAGNALRNYVKVYVARRNADAAAAQKQRVATLQSQATRLHDQIVTLSRQIDAERASSTRSASTETLTELKLATTQYQQKYQELDSALTASLRSGVPTSVVDDLTTAKITKPTSRRMLFGAGLVLGLFFGIGMVLLLEATRRKLQTVNEVEEATVMPVIATVPRRGRTRKGVAVAAAPFGPAAEGHQRARGVLQLRGLGVDVSSLSILSAEPRSGKTTFAANLAASLAGQGNPVVLVSADLRRPRLDRLFGVAGGPGLADVLEGRAMEPEMLLRRVDDNLYVLPAGKLTRNPAGLMSRPALNAVIDRLRSIGTVIVDTPAAQFAGEAIACAGATDSSVVVARIGHSTITTLNTLSLDLHRNGLPCMGVVVIGSRHGLINYRVSEYGRTSAKAARMGEDSPESLESRTAFEA